MGRLVMGIIAISIVGYLGYRAMYGRSLASPQGTSAPKQKLENVNAAARRIEEQQDKANEEALKKSTAD